MFAEALGLVGGIGSLIMGGQQYALGMQELELKRDALNQQRDFGMLNYGMAQDQLRAEREQQEYIRKANEQNQLNQAIERAKIEEQRKTRLRAYQQERQYVVDRQISVDRAQAEQYALELEAYLGNKGLAKEERELALSYLDQARAIASGEHDEDLSRLRMERLTAQQERDFAISEMQYSKNTAMSERQDDLRYRDQIMQQINAMGGALNEAYNSMGQLIAPAGPSQEEIASTLADFDANAISNVDRAADRVASQAEASLIDSGMSRSTAGEQRRAEVARKLALDYENARLNSRNQAMAFIGGKEQLKDQAFQRQVAARGTTFGELSNLYAPIIQGLTQNRQALSANQYSAPVGIGTGNVIRDVRSANQYQGPLGVGTAQSAPTGMSSRMGQTLNMPSVADAYVTTGDYNQFQPQMWNLTGPASFMGNASQLIGSIAGQYTPGTYMQMGQEQMGAGFSAIGGALVDFTKSGTYQRNAAAPSGSTSGDPWAGMRAPTTSSYTPFGNFQHWFQ